MSNSKKATIWLYFILLTLASLLCHAQTPSMHSADSPTSRVLVVHSYHNGYEWTDTQQKGIEDTLKSQPVEMQVFYMDTKKHSSEAEKIKSGLDAMAIMRDWQPDIVITTDDNAQKYFACKLAGQKDAPYVVFSGVDAKPEDYGYPAENVTGVLERSHFKESLMLLQKVCPNIEKIAVLTDNGTTSKAHIQYVKALSLPVKEIKYYEVQNIVEWKKALEKIQHEADAVAIYSWFSVKDEDGGAMDPQKVIDWTNANNKLPSMSVQPYNLALCGISHSGYEHGMTAAEMAIRIMKGEKPSDIPISLNLRGKIMFNVEIAESLNIDIPYDLLKKANALFSTD